MAQQPASSSCSDGQHAAQHHRLGWGSAQAGDGRSAWGLSDSAAGFGGYYRVGSRQAAARDCVQCTTPAPDGVGVPGCSGCSALSEALLEAEFLQELSTAQLTVVAEERDLLALQKESLLQLLARSSMLAEGG